MFIVHHLKNEEKKESDSDSNNILSIFAVIVIADVDLFSQNLIVSCCPLPSTSTNPLNPLKVKCPDICSSNVINQ